MDIAIANAVGVQASAVGNHDFDFGPVPPGNAVNLLKAAGTAPTTVSSIGAQFHYLSSNLNFAGEPSLSGRFTPDLRDSSTYAITAAALNDGAALNAAAADRTFAPWTIITENGERIGVIGATTQLQASITTLGGVTVLDPAGDGGRDNTTELATIIQSYADQLTAQGVNNAEFVQSLFQSALGRPVEAGNTFFNTVLANDTRRADVAATIVVSQEAQQFAQSFYQTGIRVA